MIYPSIRIEGDFGADFGATHLNVRIRSLDGSVGDGHYTERKNS